MFCKSEQFSILQMFSKLYCYNQLQPVAAREERINYDVARDL